MAAINPITVPLPADLPENWQNDQIVAPIGTDVDLTQQHGYNYLMWAVNQAQLACKQLGEYIPQLQLAADGGGFILYTGTLPVEQRKPRTLYARIVADYR